MSRLLPEGGAGNVWSERLLIGLAPTQVSALKLAGHWRPRLLDQHLLFLPDQPATAWDKGLAALDSLLAEPGWQKRAITVVLSSHYVRYVVLPAQSGMPVAQQQALAGAVFRETYGELARDWVLRVSPPGRSATTLASAVPRALLDGLAAVCESHGRLQAIQPHLMAVFNQARRAIADSAAALAVVEPGRVTVARLEPGQWRHVDSRACAGHSLAQRLQEEDTLHGQPPGGMLWLCDLTGRATLPASPLWREQPLVPPRLAGLAADTGQPACLAHWGLAEVG